MSANILIADDDPTERQALTTAVREIGYTAVAVDNGDAALARLTDAEDDRFALVILDLVMPGLDGMAVLARLRATHRCIPAIVQVTPGSIDMVASTLRAGAFDFLVKPASRERLSVSIENALRLGTLQRAFTRTKRVLTDTLTFDDVVAGSAAMARVIELGQRAAALPLPVLLEGEAGVGKEVIARAIHGSSERQMKPFVTVNCQALPDNLVEDALFGRDHGGGKLNQANGGTLFLDAVDALPALAQLKLARMLQGDGVRRADSRRPIKADIRIIAATSANLINLVKAGRFRDDLYYRLNVFPIWVPPLRERRGDIPALVRHFTARLAAEQGKTVIRGVSSGAMERLCRHDWPGNVRQLENAIFRAILLTDGPMLATEAFPQITVDGDVSIRPGVPRPVPATAIEIDYAASESAAAGSLAVLNGQGDIRPLAEIEAEMIGLALRRYEGRMALVARKLGIGRSTLYRKLKELGISDTLAAIAAE